MDAKTLTKMTDAKEVRFLNALKKNYSETYEVIRKELASFATDGILSPVDMAKYNRLANMTKQIELELKTLNQLKASQIKLYLDDVYEFNYYRTAYTLETSAQKKLAYGLINKRAIAESTSRELLLLALEDNANQLLVKSQQLITQIVLRGTSVSEGARLLKERLNIDSKTATQIIRTNTTSVMNKAREDSMTQAEKMGLELKKFWIATLDDRTRDRHAEIDGETRNVDKHFSNGLMYPGDPSGPPEEVYNCRCSLGTDIGLERGERRAGSQVIPYTTYEEWYKNRVVNSN
jgi:SPP1 gp7 family putative phage head morphogenesis protein